MPDERASHERCLTASGDAGSYTPMEFQNRTARFVWRFAAVWLGMLLVMTYVLARDGPAEGWFSVVESGNGSTSM